MERALELKVGAVLLAAILVLGAFVLLLGDVGLERGTRISVEYVFSGAIQPGAPVKVSGVKVGRVESLELIGGKPNAQGEHIQVRLVLFVQDRAKPVLTEGAKFYVNTQGLLGEHYVELVPAAVPGPELPDGAVVRGEDPPRFDLLVQRVYEMLDAATKLFQGDSGELGELIKAGASLAKNLDDTFKDNRGDVKRLVSSAAISAEEASLLLRSLNQAVGDGRRLESTIDDVAVTTAVLRKELPPAIEKLQKSLDDLQKLGKTLDAVDPSEVAKIVRHASAAAEHADLVLADARAITERVRAGGGTVGLLLQDDEIYDDMKELLRDLKQHPWKLVWKQ